MKEVVYGQELKDVMYEAVNLICDAVSTTLGPTGNNVLINSDECSPFITNDGVTIARFIESNDKRVNTVLEIIKEASLKTNESVGDGTTTTLVLFQSIFNEGFKEINRGKNSIILKKELYGSLDNIITELKKINKKATKDDLISIASISSNDKQIGQYISEVYFKMGSKYAIKLEEGHREETYIETKKGYNLEIDNISNLYFQNTKEIYLSDSYILILKGYLNDLEQISEIINESIIKNKKLVIFSEDANDYIKQELLTYYLKDKKNIFLFNIPEYGSRKEFIEQDLAAICGCNIKNIDFEKAYFNDLGITKSVVITKNEVILYNDNDKIKTRLHDLKKELEDNYDEYEKEFITSRIAKLEKGLSIIYVGGFTKTEIREKMMRFEDALCALEVASAGVVVGEGMTLLEVSDKIKSKTTGDKILKNSLQVPFNKIINNIGKDSEKLKNEIVKSDYKKIFDYTSNKLIDVDKTNILDPINVVIEALKNATTIAALLLTTNYLVINENIKIEKNEL